MITENKQRSITNCAGSLVVQPEVKSADAKFVRMYMVHKEDCELIHELNEEN